MAKRKICKSADKQWQYQVFADNGEHLVTSETYTQKHNAKEGFDALAIAVLKILYKEGRLGFALAEVGILDEANQPAT